MKISNSLSLVINSIQSSHSEHIFIQTLLYPITHIWQVFCQLSSLTIACPNLGFNSYSLTSLVPIYDSWRPPSQHTVLCRLYYSPFITRWIFMSVCLVCLISLPFLDIHTSELISNITRGAFSGTTYVFLFISSLFRILKCAKTTSSVHDELYSLLALHCKTGTGSCVQW